MKISVCLASYNGAKFITNQISSILNQLNDNDELIISDDGSTDDTLKIINSFNDDRIVLLNHHKNNTGKVYSHYLVTSNFENALLRAKGEIIFLSDQDDIWAPNKVKVCLEKLKKHSLVMTNCSVIDTNNNVVSESLFNSIILPRGISKNIIHPKYHGCCMAFRRDVLVFALPFPKKLILHDSWIGILAEIFGSVTYVDESLVFYRRHLNNSSFVEGESRNSIFFRLHYRVILFFQVIERIILVKYKRSVIGLFKLFNKTN